MGTFQTDTATLVIFDVERLRHRLHDVADWWTVPRIAAAEMTAGNALFVDLASDGIYELELLAGPSEPGASDAAGALHCPSGNVYVGPGEATTSEGLEPDSDCGGRFLALEPGVYFFRVAKRSPFQLEVEFKRVQRFAPAKFVDFLRLRSATEPA